MRNASRSVARIVFMTVVACVLSVGISSAASLVVRDNAEGTSSYLTDDKGMTLYMFKKDSPGKSNCVAATGCLEKWPVFFAGPLEATAGVDASSIGFITREDGLKQTTYKGMPLYYFFKDKAPGDTQGQGVNNVWYVVAP